MSSPIPVGYRRHEGGGISSLPWPADPEELPKSLAPQIIRWAEGRTDEPGLVHHITGQPWRFTKGQKRFLHLLYAVDNSGKWVYRRAVMRRSKGAGKDPLAAALALIEAAGPCRFSHFDRNGNPIGKQVGAPLVQLASNSEEQGKALLRIVNGMASGEFRGYYGIEPGKVQTYARGGLIEVLTNSESTNEGAPATCVLLNESHHMTSSSGRDRLASVSARNVAKGPLGESRLIELTNAHMPGQQSVAEATYNAWQLQIGGKTHLADILYDSLEAQPGLDLSDKNDILVGIKQAYAESPWIDVDRILAEALDPSLPTNDSVRFYLNMIPESIDAWVTPADWNACINTSLALKKKDEISLFLDCSKSEDATALVGCRISDGFSQKLGCWERPKGKAAEGWLVDRNEVDQAVRWAMSEYNVQWFGVDPSPAKDDSDEAIYWQSLLDEWHRDYRDALPYWATPGRDGHAVKWDMRWGSSGGRKRVAQLGDESRIIAAEVEEHTFRHDGDTQLMQHVLNARRKSGSIGKSTRDSTQVIDLAVAMCGARVGRRVVMLGSPNQAAKKKRKRTRVV